MGEAKRRKALAIKPGGEKALQLARFFDRLSINHQNPGFYDDPNFILEEQTRIHMLETYGEWVLYRARDEDYDQHVRGTLTKLAPIISRRLDRHQWRGGCFAITAMLTRMLDRLGVWNVVMKGSASILMSGDRRNFSIVDQTGGQGCETGHSWLIAPPYLIVDLTLKHQEWKVGDDDFQNIAPKIVLSEDAEVTRATAEDVIAAELLVAGNDAEIQRRLPDQQRFGAVFPARRLRLGSAELRYVPSGMSVPIEPLEGINTPASRGATALEIWRDDVAPAFGL